MVARGVKALKADASGQQWGMLISMLLMMLTDPRLGHVRNRFQGNNFQPPVDKDLWEKRRDYLRQRVQVSAGLWPMPERAPLKPIVHGLIQREGSTVEKVFFAVSPGFYVTGNLYRPSGKPGPFPGILCPYGHWAGGRFLWNSQELVQQELASGRETQAAAAQSHLQARCANLAMQGCIVFHYDMVGYADNKLAHRSVLTDVQAGLYGISVFGLQTLDSVRALDFLLSLPEIDPTRIACTGASGGATQTFILTAIDDRITVSAPVCMISADNHQGGCFCENGPLLRIDTDNVELASTFAPRPLVHPTAAGDWTRNYIENGYPQMKAVWRLMGDEQNIKAMRFDSPHNYNQRSREAVYEFFNEHLKLGHASPVKERAFVPIEPRDLSVYTHDHPRPDDELDETQLQKALIKQVEDSLRQLLPNDANSLRRWQRTVTVALRHLMATELPAKVNARQVETTETPQFVMSRIMLSRPDEEAKVPAWMFVPRQGAKSITVIVSGQGHASLVAPDGTPLAWVEALLKNDQSVLVVDVYLTGDLKPATLPAQLAADRPPAEHPFTYNRSTLAIRVHDILTAIGYAQQVRGPGHAHLLGLGQAGPWCALARALAPDAIAKAGLDGNGFEFGQVKTFADEMYQPLALRYGGLWGMASAMTPAETWVWNARDTAWLRSAYQVAPDNLKISETGGAADVATWLAK